MKHCVIIGSPVEHSLSPAMHNAAYKAAGIDLQYKFIAEHVSPYELSGFMDLARRDYHAIAVTIPHKEIILQYLNNLDIKAKKIGAVNTVLIQDGVLTGYNTDSPGAINALKKATDIKAKAVAVLGSGGTARALVYALCKENMNVTIYGRNREKLNKMVHDFGCNAERWEERNNASENDIIINTTPVGREGEPAPISVDGITSHHVVFDVNYNQTVIPLLNEAKQRGATIIDGLELLINQGMLQFELMTGNKAPEEAMRKVLASYGSSNKSMGIN